MKKLIVFLAFATFVFYGCEKSEMSPSSGNQEAVQANVEAYVFNLDSETPAYEATQLPLEEMQDNSNAYKSSNSAHSHGNFHGNTGNLLITFNGTENKGGTHGSAEFQQTGTVPFPPFSYTAQLTMETASVVVDGDEAIYGGLVTASEGSPFPGGGPFAVGRYFYFKIKDNGQGSNASTDQYLGVVFSISAQALNGGEDLPWYFGSFLDVEDASDKIKVNN